MTTDQLTEAYELNSEISRYQSVLEQLNSVLNPAAGKMHSADLFFYDSAGKKTVVSLQAGEMKNALIFLFQEIEKDLASKQRQFKAL